jgi:hypothetical protein
MTVSSFKVVLADISAHLQSFEIHVSSWKNIIETPPLEHQVLPVKQQLRI